MSRILITGLLTTILVICIGALVYTTLIATRTSLDVANDDAQGKVLAAMEQVLDVGTSGRLLDPLKLGVEQRFSAYHQAAVAVAHLYTSEGIPGWAADQAPGNITHYLYATLGIHKALLGQLGYLTVLYHIPHGVQTGTHQGVYAGEHWGGAGCENFGSDICYFVDDTSKFRFFNATKLTVQYESYGTAPYNHARSYTPQLQTTTVADPTAFWTTPRQEGFGAHEQKIEYVLPFEFNTTSEGGRCTAAISFNLNLTYVGTLLNSYRPSANSYVVFYDSKTVNGTFLASSNQSSPLWRYTEAVYPALGEGNPSQDVAQMLKLVVSRLSSSRGANEDVQMINVSGAFRHEAFYYEAVTVSEQFTFVVRTPLLDLYGASVPALTSVSSQEENVSLWSLWSTGDRAVVVLVAALATILALSQGVLSLLATVMSAGTAAAANTTPTPSAVASGEAVLTSPSEPYTAKETKEEWETKDSTVKK